MKKRMLCMAVALCLLIALLPVTALAAGPTGRFYYLDYGANGRVGNTYKTMSEGMAPAYYVNRKLTQEEITAAAGAKDGSGTSSTAFYTRPVTEVPTDNYIKLEYPTGGVPTITLHNVTIQNPFGLAVGWYKVQNSANANYVSTANYKIILEGNNTIANTTNNYATLKANTTGDVTITGSGSLTLTANYADKTFGVLTTLGDLILDDVNLTVICPETSGKANAIATVAGNITIKGGALTVKGIDNPNTYHDPGKTTGYGSNCEAMFSAINVCAADLLLTASDTTVTGGDLTIQDSAKVTLYGSPYQTSLVKTAGAFNIIDSDVEMGLAGKLDTSTLLSTVPTLTYTNGYNAVASTTACTYTPATDEVTAPTKTDEYNAADAATYKYFKIEAVKAPPSFAQSQVIAGNDLTLRSRISKAEVDAAGGTQVKIERTTAEGAAEPVMLPLTAEMVEGDYYVIPYDGIAAKEMGDEISMTICNAEGEAVSVTRQDSVLQYALRMLRGEKPAGYTDDQFAKLKTLLVDMLAYGAMAQELFDYNEENLVNADLTDAEKALGTQQMAACPNTKATVVAENGAEADWHIGTAFALNYSIDMAMKISGELGEGAYAQITYQDYLGAAKTAEAVATKAQDGNLVFSFKGLVAADGRQLVTWKFYAADGTLMLTVTDSMEYYVGRMIGSYTYLDALMNYSDAAKTYFMSLTTD